MEEPQPQVLDHQPKKWKAYILEFLMLFLAVFLGFLAENIREDIAEQKSAKDYAMSLMEEVAGDTSAINHSISYYKSKVENLDSIIALLTGDLKKIPGGTLYYFTDLSMYNNSITFNTTTLEQLKSSGALRFFTNRKLIKCIGDYDQFIQEVEDSESSAFTISLEARKLQFKIFDFKFKNTYNNGKFFGNISADSILLIKQTPYPLITYDPAVLAEFTNWLTLRRANLKVNMNVRLLEARSKARDLLALLKKEYLLE